MAKNYTFNEAVKIIAAGTDLEAIADIGRRFPVLAHKVAVVATKAGDDFVSLMGFMPEYLTANKVNSAIKASNSDESAEAEEKEEEATETESKAGEADYESMSAKQLWDILGKAGLRKTAKSTKKADLVEACKAMDAAKSGENTNDAEEDEGETESDNKYEGKSAVELFKECKKRGIKTQPKKTAAFYADLLTKDDEAKSEEKEEEDDDNWDEPEVKEEKKPESKATKKTNKKAETEDDDWDI